jgi:putative transposase
MRRRPSLRLTSHDYQTTGAYFVTICVRERRDLLGHIAKGRVVLSPAGQRVQRCWHDLPRHYADVRLDAFVIMPDHVHGVFWVTETGLSASEVMRAFKTFSSRAINAHRLTPGLRVWQRGFYDHIVRDEHDLARIRRYIAANPMRWWFHHHGDHGPRRGGVESDDPMDARPDPDAHGPRRGGFKTRPYGDPDAGAMGNAGMPHPFTPPSMRPWM